jgi:hypothetical protein
MRREARLWVPLAGISAGGILVGHCLGYLAAFGPGHAHHAGGTVPHRYLPTAAAADEAAFDSSESSSTIGRPAPCGRPPGDRR